MRMLISGNIACAEGALRAGCRFYAGYPITPSSEIMEYMAMELPKHGGIFFQAEDEIAAINAIIGASWGGLKSMTATSGPGFSLMQEGLGYAVMTETPLVVIDVMRVGPATGQATKSAQGDLMQARWGRHGDQQVVILAPSSPQECLDLTVKAFNISEELRVPVIVLSDEIIGHMRETVEIPEHFNIVNRKITEDLSKPPFHSDNPMEAPPMPLIGKGLNIMVTGSTHNEWGLRDTREFKTHFKLVKRLVEKIKLNAKRVFEYEEYNIENSTIGFVSFGSVARSVKGAVKILREKGVEASYINLKTLWPIIDNPIVKMAERVKAIIVPEMNMGQLVLDVERIAQNKCLVVSLNKVGGGEPIYPSEIASKALEVIG
ncbi:MAG: 2-oxoacid:acceptor oxidoreductase subunit alpha [Candidatus Methanomethylicia archaeon]